MSGDQQFTMWFIHVFCCLLNDAVSISGYNIERYIISQYSISEDVESNSHDLIWVSLHSPGGTVEYYEENSQISSWDSNSGPSKYTSGALPLNACLLQQRPETNCGHTEDI
jgi:hypothetical protein